ncbi:phosphatase PAP2 family protein [Chryseobacterium culicis]|uniref:Phosphatidic acid phosphatase n=1 Tax=Chryseobacterium culicis TaxID=680127 RepID=A0A2S9CIK4_CHRCI|nr:phosphatase PAP2 family protein [Chryseobacterium culicis]PRB80345.1 phosphatidic acid phosphatase [Chryseobacterium culicis]PRB87418.1 phosphatidic acid phosphatase [Chryseobacterium culicis]
MKKIALASGILLHLYCIKAQDTIPSRNLKEDLALINSGYTIQEKTPFFQKEWVKKSVAPALLFTAAAATWGQKENIREVRNRYLPNFKVKYDDYLQYAPAVAVYGLKLAGVKGRNNIGRATLSYGTSLAIMAILVNSIKYTAKVERPDGSNNNSFPSGHTAMAFTNASFLHKEYGIVNPAYSIAGYGSATITGLGRNLNNRHWVPDILAGAGIGIISTELGYFFIDKIYKNKGDNLSILSRIQGNDYPSFLALKSGIALGTTNFLRESELDDKKQNGFEGGLEGAYFFSKKWGVGADITFSSFPIKSQRIAFDDGQDFGNHELKTQSMGFLSAGIGPYLSHEFSPNWHLTLKLIGGYAATASGKVFLKGDEIDAPNHELQIAKYKPKPAFRWNTGASMTYKFNPGVGLTFYTDYNQINSTITYQFSDDVKGSEELDQELNNMIAKEKISYITLGLRLTAYF